MRAMLLLVVLLVSGCATLSSSPISDEKATGVGYVLPKGLVPVRVFADANGIALTIEPAQIIADTEPDALVARFHLSAFNDEDVKIAADPQTGFLKTITSNSDSKLEEIVTEAAKAAAKFAFQNARATALSQQVFVFEDNLDPLNPDDVDRINLGIAEAFSRATAAFHGATAQPLSVPNVVLKVVTPDGAPIGPMSAPNVKACRDGLCVRVMTTRVIRVEVNGTPFASKAINVPSREVTAIPVPSTFLADQDITIGITDGLLDKYEIKRGSTALGLVKAIGAIPGAVVAGVTEQLTGQKSIVDKRAELLDSQSTLIDKRQALAEKTMKFQNEAAGGGANAYAAATLTVYPHSEMLTRAIEARIEAAKNAPNPSGGDSGLTIDAVPVPPESKPAPVSPLTPAPAP